MQVSLLAVCAVFASAVAVWAAQDQGEESVAAADVPASVKEIIDNLTKAGIKVEEIQRETEDGKAVYELELEVRDDDIEIELDENGKLLDLEVEDDDEDEGDDDK
jgi:uncharacterized membrane protein YkoI